MFGHPLKYDSLIIVGRAANYSSLLPRLSVAVIVVRTKTIRVCCLADRESSITQKNIDTCLTSHSSIRSNFDYLSIGRVANKYSSHSCHSNLTTCRRRSFVRSMVLSTMSEVRGVPQPTTTTTSATINSKSGLSFHFLSEHCKDLLGIHRPSFVPFLTVLFLFMFYQRQPFGPSISKGFLSDPP